MNSKKKCHRRIFTNLELSKNENGDVLADTDYISNRWKNHLNVHGINGRNAYS
jgi:hypothetical protein